jgi:hypothetical protein
MSTQLVALLLLPLVLGGLVIVLLLAVRGSRSAAARRTGDPGPIVHPQVPPSAIPRPSPSNELLPEDLRFHIHRELGNGRKIHAIKLVRQHTRLGLKEAKEIVDALEAGWTPSPERQVPHSAGRDDRSLSERVRAFEAAGDHLAAIALVCSETGMSTAEAERFVAALR